MPNWKKVIVSGSDASLNSLSVVNNITASAISGSNLYSSLDITAQQNLRSINSSGDEGGEIFLSKAVTNTSITGGVTIDVYQNRLRFFEQGGAARGYYIDITGGGAGVSTNLVGGGGGTPGGSTTQIQYNNGGAFGGVPTLTYDGTTLRATGSFTGSFTGSLLGTSSFATSASQAITASYILNAISASFASTASSADNFLVRGTLTAQTIVTQVITSSTDFVTGSTRFGSLISNTHQFIGSVGITGSLVTTGSIIATRGSGNFIELESTGSGNRPYIKLFDNGVADLRMYSSIGAVYGALSFGDGFSFFNNTTSQYSGLVAGRIVATLGGLVATNTGGDAQVNIASPSGFSNYISFLESGVANRGVIGYANGTNYLQIRTNGATSMTTGDLAVVVDNTGRVGIGTTSPIAKLDVNGSGNFAGSVNISSSLTVSGSLGQTSISNAGETAVRVIRNSGNNFVNVQLINNVAGSAANTTLELSVSGSNNTLITKRSATAPTAFDQIKANDFVLYNTIAGDIVLFNTAPNGNIIFSAGTTSTREMFISASGQVGIGTSSPLTALHVVGTVSASAVAATSFTGSLLGTASFATSASWAPGGGGGGISFPYTGSAVITGSLVVTGSFDLGIAEFNSTSSATTAGTTIVSSYATASYNSAFYNYYISSGSNARAGQIMSVWSGSTIQYTEVTTNDIGNTNTASFAVTLATGNVRLSFTAPGVWTVRSIVNLL
jgi:hypothetical protein